MSPLLEWTHMPGASYGILFLISSRTVAQLFWHHIGNSNSTCSLIFYLLPALIRHALVKVRYLLEVLLTVCFICFICVKNLIAAQFRVCLFRNLFKGWNHKPHNEKFNSLNLLLFIVFGLGWPGLKWITTGKNYISILFSNSVGSY